MKQNGADLPEAAFLAFVRASVLFRSRMDPYFAQFGISGAQLGVLRALHRAHGEGRRGLRITELGRRLLVRPPSVTNVVDRLERMGLVARSVSADDRRAKSVALTPAGRQVLGRVLKRHPAQIQTILACLDEAEQRELHRLMNKLAAHLDSLARVKQEGDAQPCSRGARQ